MSNWIILRKTSSLVYIEYAGTFTGNLVATDAQVRITDALELSLDLSSNLRSRNKSTNDYIDAIDLAAGKADSVTLVQVFDSQIIDRLKQVLRSAPAKPNVWKLSIILDRVFTYRVEPEVSGNKPESLILHVAKLTTPEPVIQ
jgi:hypothetical protein